MKTASAQQMPKQWPDILKGVTSGEQVQVTDQDKVVATLVPAEISQPDFLSRAKSIWGENPPGKSLSEIVSDARGGEGGSIWMSGGSTKTIHGGRVPPSLSDAES